MRTGELLALQKNSRDTFNSIHSVRYNNIECVNDTQQLLLASNYLYMQDDGWYYEVISLCIKDVQETEKKQAVHGLVGIREQDARSTIGELYPRYFLDL